MPDAKELKRIHERQLKELIAAMTAAESRLTARVTQAIRAAEDDPKRAASAAYWKDRLSETSKILRHVEANWLVWVGDTERGSIVASVRDGARLVTPALKNYGLERQFRLPYDSKTVASLIEDTARVWYGAVDSADTKIQRLFRSTQQDLIREREINFTLTAEEIAGGAIQKMRSQLTKDLTASAEEGKFLTINGREYQISKYADLVARTRTREAQSIGTIRTVQEFGVDLVKWKSSADACEICEKYDAEIFSISGKNTEHEPLSDMPPLHPHCTCSITPYVEAA